ncbi:MAG: ABC transporter ATP-binding protein [Acidimicrobiales bacterium]
MAGSELSLDAGADSSDEHLFRRGVRLIVRSLRARPAAHAIAITGACVFSFAAVALTRVLAWVTDEVIVPGLDGDGVADSRVWLAVALLMGVGLVRGTGAVVRRYYLAVARFGTEVVWRNQLFRQYLHLPVAFHRGRPTGELLAHADNDMMMASTVLMPLAFALSTVVLIVIALASLVLLHPFLALVALVLFPVLATMNQLYTKRIEAPATAAQQAVGEVSSIAHESFDGILVVKALGRETDEIGRFSDAAERVRTERVRAGRLRAAFEPALDALPNIGIVVLLVVGAGLIDNGSISEGDLVGAMALFSILAFPMRIVGFFLQELPRSVVALDRIDRVLDLEIPDDLHGHEILPSGPLAVEVVGLGAAYDDQVVLEDVSFRVEPGEAVAIVGATGVGKSTLADMLVGLQAPTAGAVRIGDIAVTDLDPASRADAVALAFQEAFLFADTISENVALGRPVTEAQIREALTVAGAMEFVDQMPDGMHTVVGERGVSLSGGQRQRVALARALVGKPRVVFLDDATSAVDPIVEARILDNLRAGLDLTLIVVAHRLSTIRLADRIVFLSDGRVGGVGTHEELMALPAYEAVARAYELDDPLAGLAGPGSDGEVRS